MKQANYCAPSYTVKAAVCPPLGYNRDGSVRNPRTGQELKVKTLREIIYSQLDIPKSRNKGESGCVFPFEYDTFYSIQDIDFQSSGVVFIDLDHVDSQILSKITENFQLLCSILPDLMCLHLSYSGNGLHLYFLSPVLNKDEYCKRVIMDCMRLDKTLSKHLNIELDKAVFDAHQVSIKQRFFLNRPKDSKIYFNDNAVPTSCDQNEADSIIAAHIEEYPTLTSKWNSLNYAQPQEIQEIDFTNKTITPNNNRPPHLSHMDRMLLFNSLRVIFKDDKKKVLAAHQQCMKRMKYTSANNTQLTAAVNEPIKNNWFSYREPHISMRLLSMFYDIDELKEVESSTGSQSIEYELNEEERILLSKYI